MGETPVSSFTTLPVELQRHILWFLDLPLICRAWVAFRGHTNVAEVAANLLKNKRVVVRLYTLSESLSDISFSLLRQLPPIDVAVQANYGEWRRTAYELNRIPKFKLLLIRLIGGFAEIRGLFRCLRHPIDDLTLSYATISVDDIPNSVKLLSVDHCCILLEFFILEFTNLKTLKIVETVNSSEVMVVLPPQVEDITILDNALLQLSDLPQLTAAKVNDPAKLNCLHLKKVANIGIFPKCLHWLDLESISISMEGFLDDFQWFNCPKLTSVTIDRNLELHPYDSPASVLFTPTQMAQLTELRVYDYRIDDLTSFELLRKVSCNYNHSLCEDTPLSPHLVDLDIATPCLIKGIPPQLELFAAHNSLNEVDCNIDLTAPNLRDLNLIDYDDVSLTCPRLTNLYLEAICGEVTLDAPNLVFCTLIAVVNPFPIGDCQFLNTLTFGCRWEELVLPRPIEFLELDEAYLRVVDVEARRVLFTNTTVIDWDDGRARVRVKAYWTHIDHQLDLNFSRVSLDTQCLETSFCGVEQFPDVVFLEICQGALRDYKNVIHPDAFSNLTKLTELKIVSKEIKCSKETPLIIPASVRSLVMIDCEAIELWLQLEDETALEHLEISYWNDTVYGEKPNVKPAYFTMDTLGLTQMPPSYYCPRLQGAVTGFKRPRLK